MEGRSQLLVKDRIVSDISRFEYEKHLPRKRSRNSSPTEIKSLPIHPVLLEPPRHIIHDTQELNLGSSIYEMRDDLYDFYKGPSLVSLPRDRGYTPYPPLPPPMGIQEPSLVNPPMPPPKDLRSLYGSRNILQARHDHQDLPAMQEPQDFMAHQQDLLPQRTPARQKEVYSPEEVLLGRLINRPLFPSRYDEALDYGQLNNYIFTANNLVDFIQIAFGVIITTIASVLASIDNRIDAGYYRYFIAVGVIVLVVGLLFITKTINFERRKGVLYCLLASVLTGVALILSIATIATDNNCQTAEICQMRKVLATFSILSFFLWVCALMVFLTVLYISKLILLKKLDLDYPANEPHYPMMEKLRPSTVYREDTTLGYVTDTTEVDEMRQSRRQSQLASVPHYFFDENGKMYPLERDQDLRGTTTMIVHKRG